jgi:hypothetical protein
VTSPRRSINSRATRLFIDVSILILILRLESTGSFYFLLFFCISKDKFHKFAELQVQQIGGVYTFDTSVASRTSHLIVAHAEFNLECQYKIHSKTPIKVKH